MAVFGERVYCKPQKTSNLATNRIVDGIVTKTNTLILLICNDFDKIFVFLPNLGVFEAYLWILKIVGNRQTKKKVLFHEVEKFM